jgi:xylan 1,4-beta-xylosidase
MRKFALSVILLALMASCKTDTPPAVETVTTFCNPMDLNYRFCLDEPSRREAADPSIVWFKDRYYLFASKSGGYWHSVNLTEWTLLETDQIPVEEYAPTAIAIGDTLYFMASSTTKSTLYKSAAPDKGEWSIARERMDIPIWDPAFFLDDDNRLYLYWGCSDKNPLYGVELDENFAFIGEPAILKHANPGQYGWEVPGDYNTLVNQAPWIEGAWVNKVNGKYYLQYSGPGTEYKSYSDAVYVSDQPLGPFTIQEHNPFAYRPEGFAAGAGHGSTFTDPWGNYWHIGTITISQKHMFERRLGLFPVFFDEQGTLYSPTRFGDYPLIMPDKKISEYDEIFPGWMLLSYGKNVQVSSAVDTLPPANMTDEDIRTYWAAGSGNPGEYALLDLGRPHDVHAIQINFAEHNTAIFGRETGLAHRYTIEYSDNATDWETLIDQSDSQSDNSHPYFQLPEKKSARYLKINNLGVPGGHFALSGFRVFGKGNGELPGEVTGFTAQREEADRRKVHLSWNKVPHATGYNISFGTRNDRRYLDYQVYMDTTLTINSLNTGAVYYFSIESFNENGITPGSQVIEAR